MRIAKLRSIDYEFKVAMAALLALAFVAVAGQSQLAHAASFSHVDGQGQTAFQCSPSVPAQLTQIFFTADKSKGTLTGYGGIFGYPDVEKYFTFTKGTINKNKYTLNGTLSDSSHCGSVPIRGTVTVSGTCDAGVIHYVDSAGERIDFIFRTVNCA